MRTGITATIVCTTATANETFVFTGFEICIFEFIQTRIALEDFQNWMTKYKFR